MRFVITVNIKTTDEPSENSFPLAAMIAHALPTILDILNVKAPEPEQPPEVKDSPEEPVSL